MTYEYQCGACSHQWEAEQSISEPALTQCPACKAEAAKRMVSGGQGFILKGGGWYADGYGSKKSGSAGKSDNGSSTSSTTKPETKSETKPESKAPPPAAAGTGSAGGTKA